MENLGNSQTVSHAMRHFMWVCAAGVLTIDLALFSDDHVPYYFYLGKFVVLLCLLEAGDFFLRKHSDVQQTKIRKQLMLFACLMAIVFVLVVFFVFAG